MTPRSGLLLRQVTLAVIFCLGLFVSLRAAAQKAESDYVLTPGDVIDISVLNHTDLDKTVTVLPDGKIAFAAVGEIKAAGKTPKALAAELYQILDKTLNSFNVTVTVKELRARKVRIIGAVKTAGAFDYKEGTRLLDVVAAAGGLSNKPARITGRIIRGGITVIPLNVEAAIAKPETEANTPMVIDDLVLLDETEAPAKPQVFAMGQVGKPGAYDLDPSTTILSLLSLAGNGTDKASFAKAYVLRSGKEMPLNLRPLVVEGKSDPAVTGFVLQSGDVLFLPENDAKITVWGAVNKPGTYALPEKGKMMVMDALNLAGVNTQTANTAKAGIIRNAGGKASMMPINLDKILKKGDATANIPMQADDILYIPQRGNTSGLSDLYLPFSILNVLGFRLFR